MPSYRAFRQIKIRHIFIMQFGGYFVKFYSRQIFRPYGSSQHWSRQCSKGTDSLKTTKLKPQETLIIINIINRMHHIPYMEILCVLFLWFTCTVL